MEVPLINALDSISVGMEFTLFKYEKYPLTRVIPKLRLRSPYKLSTFVAFEILTNKDKRPPY